MFKNSLPSHHILVEAAKITYSRNGFAILKDDSSLLYGIDFIAVSTGNEKIAVKCIFVPETEIIDQEAIDQFKNQAPKKMRLHLVTPARFSRAASDYAKKKKIHLVNGSRVKWAFGTYTVEAEKVPSCIGGPSRSHRIKSAGKSSLGFVMRASIVAAIGVAVYGFDKAEWVDGSLRFGGPKASELETSEYHFAKSHEGVSDSTLARKDAIALSRHLQMEKHRGVDFLMIAGDDIETAVRLLAEKYRFSTSEAHPELQANFDRICDPASDRLQNAVAYLKVDEGLVVYQKDLSRFEKIANVAQDKIRSIED